MKHCVVDLGFALNRDQCCEVLDEIGRLRAELDEQRKLVIDHNEYMKNAPTMEAAPASPEEALRTIAVWFDYVYRDAGTGKDKFQCDLHRFADEIERLRALNEDKHRHLQSYCKAATEDKDEIERLLAENEQLQADLAATLAMTGPELAEARERMLRKEHDDAH